MNNLFKLRYSFLTKRCLDCAVKQRDNIIRTTSFLRIQEVQRRNSFEKNFSYPFCPSREYASSGSRAQGKMKKGGKGKAQQLSDEEMADVIAIQDYRGQLSEVVNNLKRDYVENLSLRSAAGKIDKLLVKIDDEEYPLNELAVISKKNPNLVAINMTDFPQGLKPTIQAILDSGADLNPQQEGTMIYIQIPKVTREHREQLAKNAKSLFIKAKDEVRAIQNMFTKEAKEKTELSEDLVFSATNQIKTMAEQCAVDLEKTMKTKQKELLGEG